MKSIGSIAVALLLSSAIGGVLFSDSQVVNQPGSLIAQQDPSPTPTPTPTTPTPTPTPTTPTPTPSP